MNKYNPTGSSFDDFLKLDIIKGDKMISAKKAQRLVEERGEVVFTNKKAVDKHIYTMAELGFINADITISTSICGSVIQELMDKGFKVFATVNYFKNTTEVSIEWT